MEILDDELKEDYGIDSNMEDSSNSERSVETIPHRIIQREEMPQIIETWFRKLSSIQINNIPLIFKTFNNDTIIVDPKLTIEVINQALGIKEPDIFKFINNLYFYSQDKILEEAFGKFRFIQIPPLTFTQTGLNRFQLDF